MYVLSDEMFMTTKTTSTMVKTVHSRMTLLNLTHSQHGMTTPYQRRDVPWVVAVSFCRIYIAK